MALVAASLLTCAVGCGSPPPAGGGGQTSGGSGKGTLTGAYTLTGERPAKGNFSEPLDTSCAGFAATSSLRAAGYALAQPKLNFDFHIGAVNVGVGVSTHAYKGPGTYPGADAGVSLGDSNGNPLPGYQTGFGTGTATMTLNGDGSGDASFANMQHFGSPTPPGTESGSITWTCH